jgi:hypothetical protein
MRPPDLQSRWPKSISSTTLKTYTGAEAMAANEAGFSVYDVDEATMGQWV